MKTGREAFKTVRLSVVETALWRECAEIYLAKMWFGQDEQDKRLVASFSNGAVTCEMLRDLCSRGNTGSPGRFQVMVGTSTRDLQTC